MSRFTRVVVLVAALMSVAGVGASAAEAITWDNSGATAFTATGGAVTYTGTDLTFPCTNTTTTGTAPTAQSSPPA